MTLEVTFCSVCGAEIGAPHVRLEDDCVMPHEDHADRKHGYLCGRHWHWLGDTLTQIEELWALRDEVVMPGTGSDVRVSGGDVEAAAPGRLDVMALTDRRANEWIDDEDAVPNVSEALESWLRIVDEERGGALLPFSGAMFAVDRRGVTVDLTIVPTPEDRHRHSHPMFWSIPIGMVIRLLRREQRWIVQQPWVDDYAADLARLHRTLGTVTGARMWPSSIGKCPNCPGRIYPDPAGADVVTCKRCGSTWSGVHYLRLRLMLDQAKGGAR